MAKAAQKKAPARKLALDRGNTVYVVGLTTVWRYHWPAVFIDKHLMHPHLMLLPLLWKAGMEHQKVLT
mgnify:CR=1 FL=1